MNGSIFINGDCNIQTLTPMTHIKHIEGYLIIYDSHTLMSLKGLQNLQTINAYNPYLLQYGGLLNTTIIPMMTHQVFVLQIL